jgi:hypothetical protein
VWEHRAVKEPLDLLVGVTWIGVALVLWPRQRTRAAAILPGAFGATWLLGDLDPALLFLHRGPLAHLLLAYPTGRLGSLPARVAVAAAYLSGIAAGQGDAQEWTLAFAAGLVAAVSIRSFRATGIVRRSRLAPLLVASGVGALLAVGAGAQVDVLAVYEALLVLAGVAVALDLRGARWSQGAITERRLLGSDLRAQVDPLLQRAAGELGSEPALLARLDDVRHQLFRVAAGLDLIALHDGGLEPALRELADHAGLPTSVSVEAGRFPAAVESCVWFTCAEAMANAHKHAYATRPDISLRRRDGVLRVEVADDGVGGADSNGGSGLRRLRERVRSAGGELAVDSRPGHGTRVVAELELGAGA